MPQTQDVKRFLAFWTFHRRSMALVSHIDPNIPPSIVQSHEEILNEVVDHDSDEVLDLDSLLDRQSFRANWVTLQPSILINLGFWTRNCGLYDMANSRWKHIDDNVPLDVLVSLFRRIIDAFQDDHCDNRDIVYSTASYAPPPGNPVFKSMPSLAVCGTRWPFPSPNGGCYLDSGSTFHLGAIEVAFEREIRESHEILQMGIYARKYLLEQPSRHAVTCLLLTEVNVRVYSFDSNGLVYFDAVNIHERPMDFLSAISRISLDSISREFDHATHWRNGHVFMHNRNPFYCPFEIVGGVPLYTSENFIGKRTVCWKVRGRTGRVCLLKNSSAFLDATKDMFLEWQFLRLARGIPGVCRVYGHHEKFVVCPLIRMLRPDFLLRAETPVPYNVRCYLALEYYERSILHFNDRMDLLCILRDAIVTHERLWMKGIWHDDIRPENIRIANPGSKDGSRAVLIGFARAKKVDPMDGLNSNFNWGDERRDSHKYKSRLRPLRYTFYYGYLHDLESFLLILCSICSVLRRPHAGALPDQIVLQNMAGWSDNTAVASELKEAFLKQADRPGRVTPYFGQVFVDLISAWRVWSDAAFMEAPSHAHWKLNQTRTHYGDILDMIDRAIDRVKEEEARPYFFFNNMMLRTNLRSNPST